MTTTGPSPLLLDLAERYLVGSEIGRGGMATVHVASDRDSGERVAVKVMARQLLSRAATRRRFENEVEVLDTCRSPYVLRLIGSGTWQDRPAYVAELCHGSLFDLAKDRPLPLRRTLELVSEALAGLDTVHAAGVVHRDLKPSNLLMGMDGKVRVADFGICRHPTRRNTTEGRTIGTPSYTAPELQFEATTAAPVHDLFALGLCLFTLSTHMRTTYLTEAKFRASSLHRFPDATARLVDRATHPDPAQRYRHAAHMAMDVQNALIELEGS